MSEGKRVSIKLTPEQRARIKEVTGKAPTMMELGVEELEERIAPSRLKIDMADGINIGIGELASRNIDLQFK